MSPRSTPSRAAVSGWISTQELHSTLVTGSGSSCSHGLLAPRPSPSVGDGYVTRKKSPLCAGAVAESGAAAAVCVVDATPARGAIEPATNPFAYESAIPAAFAL